MQKKYSVDVTESRQGVMMGGALKIATKIVGKRRMGVVRLGGIFM